MDLEYSNHAIIQKEERFITDIEVIECLDDWDTRHTDKKVNQIFRKVLSSGRGIKVVVAKNNNRFIITVADY